VIWAVGRAALWLGCAILIGTSFSSVVGAQNLRFDRDTLSFANATVLDYQQGVARLRTGTDKEQSHRYSRRCFVMCRTVTQFQKFARFDPHAAPLSDQELAQRVRLVTKHAVWKDAFPDDQRVVFPGYANLRQLSKERRSVLQKNLGLGWPTYFRVGNYRMAFNLSRGYQRQMHEGLNSALARGQLFVAFLSDFPTLHINHAVVVYGKKPSNSNEERYNCYDPNHPDGPRELTWFPDKEVFNFEKDEEFVGGFTRVYQVYGRPLQ